MATQGERRCSTATLFSNYVSWGFGGSASWGSGVGAGWVLAALTEGTYQTRVPDPLSIYKVSPNARLFESCPLPHHNFFLRVEANLKVAESETRKSRLQQERKDSRPLPRPKLFLCVFSEML